MPAWRILGSRRGDPRWRRYLVAADEAAALSATEPDPPPPGPGHSGNSGGPSGSPVQRIITGWASAQRAALRTQCTPVNPVVRGVSGGDTPLTGRRCVR